MSKKYLLDNQEIELGDVLTMNKRTNIPGGYVAVKRMQTLDEKLAKKLVAEGILKEIPEDNGYDKINTNLGYYLARIARRVNSNGRSTTTTEVLATLKNMVHFNKFAAFSTLLKEIAVEIDKVFYHDHINNGKTVYIYSPAADRIQPLLEPNKKIIDWTLFSAFRTKEDCEFGVRLACRFIEQLYHE